MTAVDDAALRGRDLWLRAGRDLLRTGGVRAIKVRSLADHLGLTTGSFYHHFSGMQDFLDGLATDHPGTDRVAELRSLQPLPATERLARLVALHVVDEVRLLDVAMREWAATNVLAAEAVRRSDALVLSFLAAAFAELGHDEAACRLRAQLLHAALVARVAWPWPVDEAFRAELVAALV